MLKFMAVGLMALLLVGCDEEEREASRTRNEQRLPPGCKIIDLDYRDLQAAVVCEGRKTNTTVRSYRSGKTTRHSLIAEIGEPH